MSDYPTDPRQLLDSLDADAITARLDDLDEERRALLTLLRAARRRRPGAGERPSSPSPSPVTHEE
jgi:hypothetical protein